MHRLRGLHDRYIPIRHAVWLACLLALSACATTGDGSASLPPMPATASGVPSEAVDSPPQLVHFVKQAAGQVEREGLDALDAFAESDGPWQAQAAHLFVLDAEGRALHYDIAPHLVGQDLTPFTDTNGRPFVQWQLEALNNTSGTTWSFYRWPPPQSFTPMWVASFAQRVAGPDRQMYLVGGAAYNLAPDRTLLRELATMAANQLRQDSAAALRQIRDIEGPMIYRDAHVVVLNEAGQIIAAPQPEMAALPDAVAQWMRQGDGAKDELTWPGAPDGGDAVRAQVYGKRIRVSGDTYFVLALSGD